MLDYFELMLFVGLLIGTVCALFAALDLFDNEAPSPRKSIGRVALVFFGGVFSVVFFPLVIAALMFYVIVAGIKDDWHWYETMRADR